MLLRAQAAVGWPLDWVGPLIVLGLLALAGGGLAWRRVGFGFPSLDKEGWRVAPGWFERGLFILLLAWLSWRFFLLAQEVWLRPLYPWDAWTTWEVRARVWSELQQLVPFVDPQRWLADASGSVYTVHAWEYPDAVSLLALWPTLAFGAWHEPVAHLPWLGAAVALGLGFYGQARLWGASPLTALIFVWLCCRCRCWIPTLPWPVMRICGWRRCLDWRFAPYCNGRGPATAGRGYWRCCWRWPVRGSSGKGWFGRCC